MHTFVLPIVLPTLLNIIILMLLFRYNRRVNAVGMNASSEDVVRQEETEENALQNNTVSDADDMATVASRRNPKDDVKCFRYLTRIVIGKAESDGHLDMELCEYTPRLVAQLTDEDMLRIMNETGGYLRSRWLSVPVNARQFVTVVQEFGSFRAYIESLIHPAGSGQDQPSPGLGTQAVMVANDMRWRGFKQIGPSRALELLGKMYGIRRPSANLPDFHVFSKHK